MFGLSILSTMNSIPENSAAPLPEHPIDRACRILGINNSELAKRLGLTKANVCDWKREGVEVPAPHAASIEELTDGLVRADELNQKVKWSAIRKNGTAWSSL
jgi:DNA-binding transcriptional regulator YdaS (Cro superfamily)